MRKAAPACDPWLRAQRGCSHASEMPCVWMMHQMRSLTCTNQHHSVIASGGGKGVHGSLWDNSHHGFDLWMPETACHFAEVCLGRNAFVGRVCSQPQPPCHVCPLLLTTKHVASPRAPASCLLLCSADLVVAPFHFAPVPVASPRSVYSHFVAHRWIAEARLSELWYAHCCSPGLCPDIAVACNAVHATSYMSRAKPVPVDGTRLCAPGTTR